MRWLLIAVCAALLGVNSLAGEERYEYDALGRLLRMIDARDRVTDYVYDAVGNILEVRTDGVALPPTVSGISPTSLRRGTTATITISGANLANVELLVADPQLQISDVTRGATSLTFKLQVGLKAVLGSSALVLRNARGEVTRTFTIQPALPVMAVEPTPLAIPPDSVARGFTVTLDHPDVVDHTVSVSSELPGIASVSPASAAILAGQTKATFQVKGLIGGLTVIRLSSPGLVDVAVPVFVTAEFRGISTALAPAVGVDLAGAGGPPPGIATNIYSKSVGIGFGSFWLDTSPRGLSVGSSGVITISGSSLPSALTVALAPAEGITLGTPVVSADAKQATIPVTVAADAVLGARKLTVSSGGQILAAATPGADRFDVFHAPPELISIDPIFGTAGTTINPFVVRGRNLFDAQALVFSGAGIVAGTQPVVNTQGTELTTAIAISPVAAPGERTVRVLTPSGSTSATLSSSNAFSVVETVGDTFKNLVSPSVGVNFGGTGGPPAGSAVGLFSPVVGVSLGSIVNSVTPNTGAIGQSLSLLLAGRDLAGVSSVSILPSTGVTVGTPVVAADGSNVQVPVTIAADAPVGPRKLELLAGGTKVPFAGPQGDRFDVTLLKPVVASIDPLIVQTGSSVGFVLRGSNLQGATKVNINPPDGVAVGTVSVNPSGDIASVVVAVGASAVPGPRVVSIVTAAGESSTVAGPTNTVTLSTTAGTTYSSVLSQSVGVELASSTPPPTVSQSVYARPVGVEIPVAPPPSSSIDLYAKPVGLAWGAVALGLEPLGFNVGETGTVVVRGMQLPASTTLAFEPAAGITLNGSPVVAADGRSVTQSITIAADAAQVPRGVRLSAEGLPISLPTGVDLSLTIGPGAPNIVSLATILARQGDTLSLVIRGTNLRDVVEVLAEPASGVIFGQSPTVAADGTQLSVGVFVAPDAALGGRVIRVRTRSGISTSVAAPANTFTVFPP